MARAKGSDFFHSHKFSIIDLGTAQFLEPSAGFNTLVMPEYTLDAVEYKEGIWTYRRKYPGDVTVTDITMTRGVAKTDTKFFTWVKAAIEGREYRTDLEIRHFHRDDVEGLLDYTNVKSVSRKIKIFEAFPIRVKLGSDFDSLSPEVSIQELDLSIERLEIEVL